MQKIRKIGGTVTEIWCFPTNYQQNGDRAQLKLRTDNLPKGKALNFRSLELENLKNIKTCQTCQKE